MRFNRFQRRPRPEYYTRPLARALPQIRPRALTPPLATEPQSPWYKLRRRVQQQTLSQSSSILFTKLPFDIRHAIWMEVLGGGVFHFICAACTLKGWSCVGNQPVNFVPLLQTCRMIYFEATQVLYSSSTFDIKDDEVLFNLQRMSLPQRLNQIRSLEVLCPWSFVPGTQNTSHATMEDTWKQMCTTLKTSFTGLTDLTVHIKIVQDHPSISGKRVLYEPTLAPLRELCAPRKIRIIAPLSAEECAEACSGSDRFHVLPDDVSSSEDHPPCNCEHTMDEHGYCIMVKLSVTYA